MSISNQTHMRLKPAISFAPVVAGTLQRACCSRHQIAICDHDDPHKKSQMLENKAIGLQSRGIYSRSDDNIVGFSGIQRKSAINEPGDQYEMEADRIADEVVNQDRAGNASFIHQSSSPLLQRQGQSGPQPSQEEQYKNAAEKAGEAFLKINLGRDIKDKALKQGKDFISTLRGKIITGAAAAGVVSTLAATNSKLPMQVPEIPLDFITPGLKVKLNYEGPVRNPTSASLTFTYVEQVQNKERKGEPTEREKFRAETARIAEDQAKLREGLKTPELRAAEHEQFMNAYWGRKNRLGLDPIRVPGLVDKEKKPSLDMRDIRPKRDEEGLQRKAEGSKPLAGIPPIVHEVLRSSGQPLEPGTRAFMEERFGYDFSRVKVHTDGNAAESARTMNAFAYTAGHDIVFRDGHYIQNSKEGRKLIAHELTHVLQQAGTARNRVSSYISKSPFEEQANRRAGSVAEEQPNAASCGSGNNDLLFHSSRLRTKSLEESSGSIKEHAVIQFFAPNSQGSNNHANTGTILPQHPVLPPAKSDYSYLHVIGMPIVDGVGPDDAYQSGIGDCWLISALAAVAKSDPGIITKSIRYAGPNQWWILLWHKKGGEAPVFEAEWMLVNQDLPVDKEGKLAFARGRAPLKLGECRIEYRNKMVYDPLRVEPIPDDEPYDYICEMIPDEAKRELWPSLYEKAFAIFFSKHKDMLRNENQARGYAGLENNSPSKALEIIIGSPAKVTEIDESSNDDLFNQIRITLDNKQPVVASTKDPLNIEGLLGHHAYTIMYVFPDTKEISLREPNSGNIFNIYFNKFKLGFSHVTIGGKTRWLQ